MAAKQESLKARFDADIAPQLRTELQLKSIMQVPRPVKVTLNMGVGEALVDRKAIEEAAQILTHISGQKSVVTRARKSVASFKIRTGYPIGCMVTLRSEQMYQFMDRLVRVVMPRIRDFRGLRPRSFDKRGNFHLGIRENLVFPELDLDKMTRIRGLNVSVTTTALNDEQGLALLKKLGFPFREQ